MGKLRDRMLVDLQLNGAKPSTQRTYLREAENLAKYFHKSPEQLGEDELKAYLLYLMKERHLSEATLRIGILHTWGQCPPLLIVSIQPTVRN
jgi:integrase/recombinase XerD